MAEEEEAKRKINFKKIALFGLGPIVLVGVGLGIGAFLFMPTQTPVEPSPVNNLPINTPRNGQSMTSKNQKTLQRCYMRRLSRLGHHKSIRLLVEGRSWARVLSK